MIQRSEAEQNERQTEHIGQRQRQQTHRYRRQIDRTTFER